MKITICRSQRKDLESLLSLVRSYHEFEELKSTVSDRRKAILKLLENPDIGIIWLVYCGEQIAGYIVLCRSYSIEFKGFDAFIDEFFIDTAFRNKGVGSQVLNLVKQEAKKLDITALHLEVARDNISASSFYSKHGFQSRDKYTLMSVKL